MSGSEIELVGIYSQPYNEIVKPNQIWAVSRYFVRRWGPYLTPSRFWAVIAARQHAYWNGAAPANDWFDAHDGQLAGTANLSRIHFRRIKAELGEGQNAISLFLDKAAEEHEYHVVDGKTRPRPMRYYVRLDDPLTPADTQHLLAWLPAQDSRRQAAEVAALLEAAQSGPRKALLAPNLSAYLEDPPAAFRPLTVLDAVRRAFGKTIAAQERVRQEAEKLHLYLTGADYLGRHYFRREWLPILNAGPAYLVTYLRSLCYYQPDGGELRNEITFTRPQLAQDLGVTPRTISNWIKKIEASVPEQPIPPFMQLVEKKRTPDNEVAFTYRIGLLEPFTAADLARYKAKAVQLNRLDVSEPEAHGKNVSHNAALTPGSQGKNVSHEQDAAGPAQGKNVSHTLPEAERQGKNVSHGKEPHSQAVGKNVSHTPDLEEKMIAGPGKKDDPSPKKRFPFKHYKTIIQTLSLETNTFLAAAESPLWKLADRQALLSLGQAAAGGSLASLLDLLGVDAGGPVRARMQAGDLILDDITAWYLYACQQEGLAKPPLHLTISRVLDGQPPPADFGRLARLSWELWRSFACLSALAPQEREWVNACLAGAPGYETWMRRYGHCRPEELPFGVGEGVEELSCLAAAGQGREVADWPAAGAEQALVEALQLEPVAADWPRVLAELELQMTRATFNSWLRDACLLGRDKAGCYVIGVRNEYAREWLEHRLHEVVGRTLAAVMGDSAEIQFIVFEE